VKGTKKRAAVRRLTSFERFICERERTLYLILSFIFSKVTSRPTLKRIDGIQQDLNDLGLGSVKRTLVI